MLDFDAAHTYNSARLAPHVINVARLLPSDGSSQPRNEQTQSVRPIP